MTRPFSNDAVAATFNGANGTARDGMLGLRALIFDVADTLPEIGPVEETLRWGQPAYLTPHRKSATTLRLGVPKSASFGLFVHCQTSLISDLYNMFPGQDRVEGTRAVLFDAPEQIDPVRHGWLIRRGLTYHL